MLASAMAVIGAVPVLARVSDWVLDAPTAIDPKLRLDGKICRWDWMAEPVSGTVSGSDAAELAMDRVPVRVPDWVGANVTCRAQEVAAGIAAPAGQEPGATV